MVAAAMLRHRLHFTHRGQRNCASKFTTSVPFTVRSHMTIRLSLSTCFDTSPQD